MHTYQATPYSMHHVGNAGAKLPRALVVLVVAAFAALTGAYFFVQAGDSYPEPSTLATD